MPAIPYGLTRQAANVSTLSIPTIRHHRRRSGAKAPRRKAASISAKTRMIGPSTNSPCELTHATCTIGKTTAR